MIVLSPLYTTDSSFWNGEKGRDLLRQFLLKVAVEGKPYRYIATADSSELLSLARYCGWEAVRTNGLDTDCLRVVPGMEAALKAVRDYARPDEPVLVANFRNPFLDAGIVNRAAALYETHPEFGLVSVRAPLDHPCQFNQYFRFEDAGLMILRDENATDFSLPCPWEWGWFEEEAGQTDYAYDEVTFGIKPGGGESLFLRKQDKQHARCAMREVRGGFVNPVILPQESGSVRADVVYDDRCRLSFEIDDHADFILRAIPFSPETLHWNCAFETISSWPHPDQEMPFPKEFTGMVFFLLSVVKNGGYDMVSAFIPPKAPWTTKIGMFNVRFNLDTGKKIHGRQAFPLIYEPDGSLCVVPGIHGQAYDTAILEQGYPLELGRHSLIIEDELDYIAYAILQRQKT